LKANAKFCFVDTEKHAFEQLREILSKKPILRIYITEAETELRTDASAQGYATILLQRGSFFIPNVLCERKNNGNGTEIS